MYRVAIIAFFAACLFLFAAAKPVPYGPVKAFKGPEGEIVTMVEVNDAKGILVHYKNIGGDIEGKSFLYNIEISGRGRKDITYQKKRGSKMRTFYVLSFRDGIWTFHNPVTNQPLRMTYSEKDSEKIKVEDVMNAYKP